MKMLRKLLPILFILCLSIIYGLAYLPQYLTNTEKVNIETVTAEMGYYYAEPTEEDLKKATELTKETTELSGEIKYKLEKDLTLEQNLVIKSGAKVTLYLNGYVLKGNGSGPVITIESGGTLTVYGDAIEGVTREQHYGTLTHTMTWANLAGDGKCTAGLWVWESNATKDTEGAVAISGGVITGGKAGTSSGAKVAGSGVYVANGGTFTMNGGTIAGNEATATIGGGLGVDVGATADLNNVNIWYNYNGVNKGKGAGIACEGTLTINTASVKGNHCDKSNSMGGGLYFETANAKGTLNNVTITENYAVLVAGGIAVYSGASVTMDGGLIRDNNTTQNQDRNGMNINGTASSATISNLTVDDGIGLPNGILKVGSGCVISKKIITSGSYTIDYKDTEYKLTNGVLEPVIQTTVADDVCYISNAPDTTYGTLKEAYATLQASGTTGTIVLLKDFVQDGTLTIDSTVTINLNGHVFSGNATDSVITIAKGGTLTLMDSTYGTEAALTHYGTVGADHVWKWSQSDTGTTAISGGIITGGKASAGGGGICVKDGGELVMTGTTIAGNVGTSANVAGGGLRIEKGATATLNNVTVRNNKGNAGGGGIFVAGELTMTGGSIRDNYLTDSTSYNGSGLLVLGWNEAATAELKNVVIENNVSATATGKYSGAGICVGSTENKNNQWATLSMSGCTVQNNRYNGEIVDMSVSDQCSVTLTGDTTTIPGKIVLNNNSLNPPYLIVNNESLPEYDEHGEAKAGVTAEIKINNQKEVVTWKSMLSLPKGYKWDSETTSDTYQKIVEVNDGDTDDDTDDDTYIYFDLAAGNIEISKQSDGSTQYKGYIYDNTSGTSKPEEIIGTYTRDKVFYIYQSSTDNQKTTGKVLVDGEAQMVLPAYDDLSISAADDNGQTTNQAWSDYITNNSSVENVIDAWDTAIKSTKREACSNYIKITKAASATVILDNLYSTYVENTSKNNEAPLWIEMSTTMQTTLTLQLKGDSRFRNIYYKSTKKNMGTLVIESASEDASSNDGSMTVAPFIKNMPNSISSTTYPNCTAIIGAAECDEYGLTFNGGTVFAGFPAQDNHVWGDRSKVAFATCIGGGNNKDGEVTVTGGRLTAVSNGTSPAIGGGGGYNEVGGCGKVDISGGEVYAYATGIYSTSTETFNGVQRNVGFVPTTAIGGSSTFIGTAKGGTVVNITGGYVYAESLGGTAIGGGNSQESTGGSATVNISGAAEVHAVSSAGTAGDSTTGNYTEVSAGNAIGGGCGVSGGDAVVNISGNCKVTATGIGGGTAKVSIDKNNGELVGNGGDATVTVSGGETTLTIGIGGGDSEIANGGDATVTITGGTIDAGQYIGGGTGCTNGTDALGNGGNATISISGDDTKIKTGTIGGGTTESTNDSAHIGYANATITGGTIQGQFLLRQVSDDSDHCTFTMSGGIIHDTNANDEKYASRREKDGGAVWMDDTNGVVEITGGTIENCSATRGGAIYMKAGTVTMSGGTIDTCSATNGGAIYMTAGTVTMSGGEIIGCTASSNGGGIYIVDEGEVIMEKTAAIKNCKAETGSGGGIYQGGGDVTVTGSTISKNSASANGGGVYVNNGDFTLTGGTVSGNEAYTSVLSKPYDLNLASTLYSPNKGNGGGVYVKDGNFIMENGTVSGNKCSRYGGGIYVYAEGKTITLKGGEISGNKAAQSGGGITAFKTNITLTYAAEGEDKDGVSITGNQSVNGGGIYVRYDATMTMEGGTVSGNKAVSLIGNEEDEFYGFIAFAMKSALDSDDLVQEDDSDWGGNGGGIIVHNATLIFKGGTVSGNEAQRSGGGMYLIQEETNERTSDTDTTKNNCNLSLTIEDGTIVSNTAVLHGGGIALLQPKEIGNATANVSITGDVNISENKASGNGGGVYINGGDFTLSGGTISNNTALDWNTLNSLESGNGGGVYAKNGLFTMKDGTVSYNQCSRFGGGIYVYDETNNTGTTANTETTGYTETTDNAGISTKAKMAFAKKTVSNSKARTTSEEEPKVILKGGTIYGNKAAQCGGGVTVLKTDILLTTGDNGNGVSITDNKAICGGGLYVRYNATLEMEGGVVQGNNAYSLNDTTLNTDSTFKEIVKCNVDNTSIALFGGDNDNGGNGGGIMVHNATLQFNGGTVSGNVAARNGGGMYLIQETSDDSASPLNIVVEDGDIKENTAGLHGGGIALLQPDLDETVDAKVTISGEVEISGNTASGNGGGVYINGGDFTLNGGTISYNTALYWTTLNSLERGNGGGVYAKNGLFTMKDGTVSYNECSRFGGGIYVYDETNNTETSSKARTTSELEYKVVLEGGEISYNKAAQSGGGVTAFKANIKLTKGTDDSGVQITENEAICGGGLYVRYNATLRMEGGSVTKNKAVSFKDKENDSTSFYCCVAGVLSEDMNTDRTSLALFGEKENDYGGNGGGIMVHNASIELVGGSDNDDSCLIEGNEAERNGGAIYLIQKTGKDASTDEDNDNPLYATIENGTIQNNTAAVNGGGIAMFQPDGDNVTAEATIKGNVKIYQNIAQNGGGFYVGGGKLTVTGGIMTENQAKGSPNDGVTTAANDADNIGVGGGIYVYNKGKFYLEIATTDNTDSTKENIGVYSNLADFAADDIYCSKDSESEIKIPAVDNMYLIDYKNHVIGKAIGWFLDYPEGDTVEVETIESKNPIRYRTAEASQDDVNKKESFLLNTEEASKTVQDYICLTLGYTYLRINVTVENEVSPVDDTEFEYTVYVEGEISDEEKKSEFRTPRLIFNEDDVVDGTDIEYTIINDGSTSGKAEIKFSLTNGEKIELQGIPVGTKITIEESNGDYTTAHTYDGTTTSGKTFKKTVGNKYEYVLFYNSKDFKTLFYYVPYMPDSENTSDSLGTLSNDLIMALAIDDEEDTEETEDIEDEENTEKTEDIEDEENPEDIEDIGDEENPEEIEDIEDEENPEDMDNTENHEDSADKDDADASANEEKPEETECDENTETLENQYDEENSNESDDKVNNTEDLDVKEKSCEIATENSRSSVKTYRLARLSTTNVEDDSFETQGESEDEPKDESEDETKESSTESGDEPEESPSELECELGSETEDEQEDEPKSSSQSVNKKSKIRANSYDSKAYDSSWTLAGFEMYPLNWKVQVEELMKLDGIEYWCFDGYDIENTKVEAAFKMDRDIDLYGAETLGGIVSGDNNKDDTSTKTHIYYYTIEGEYLGEDGSENFPWFVTKNDLKDYKDYKDVPEGYEFRGWLQTKGDYSSVITDSTTLVIVGSKTIYAWVQEIGTEPEIETNTLYYCDMDGNVLYMDYYPKNNNFILGSTIINGYKGKTLSGLKGWLQTKGVTTSVIKDNNNIYMSSDKYIYAWIDEESSKQEIPKETYTLSYRDADGNRLATDEVEAGKTIKGSDLKPYSGEIRDGYEFKGWLRTKGDSSTLITNDDTINMSDNISIYAWIEEKTYTLSYYNADGTQKVSEKNIKAVTESQIKGSDLESSYGGEIPDGYEFKGWLTKMGDSTTLINADATIDMSNGNISIYAWIAKKEQKSTPSATDTTDTTDSNASSTQPESSAENTDSAPATEQAPTTNQTQPTEQPVTITEPETTAIPPVPLTPTEPEEIQSEQVISEPVTGDESHSEIWKGMVAVGTVIALASAIQIRRKKNKG